MQTKREYLVGLGLAKPGRGKFSRVALEALAKAEAEGVKFIEPVPAKPVRTPAPVADKPAKVEEVPSYSQYLLPSDFRFPESEYRAVGFVSGKRTIYSMRECCNTCRVSLTNHACNSPSILGNIAVKIERVSA